MHAIGRAIGHTRFIPFGIRDRALRILFPPQLRIDRPFVIPLGSARYAGNLDNYIDWSVYFFGQYERYMLRWIAAVLPKLDAAPVFWDVGANSGQHSIFTASLGAIVESFEPFEPVRQKLAHSASLNPDLSIRIHSYGLGDQDCVLSFAPPDNENFATGHFTNTGTIELPIRRGDDVSADPPTLVKIDVEGMEADVLRGALRTFTTSRPIIICELSERTARQGDIRQFLPPDYRAVVLDGPERPRLRDFTAAYRGETAVFFPSNLTSVVAASFA
jgi:FkbM family methyltransferase